MDLNPTHSELSQTLRKDENPYRPPVPIGPDKKKIGPDKKKGWVEQLKGKQDALVCLVDQGIVSVAGFVTTILIGRYSSSELGVYYIALHIVLFVRGIQQQMICIPYTIYQHQHSDQRAEQYRGSCLVQHFGLMALALLFVAGQTIFTVNGWGEAESVPTLLVLLALLPVLMMREIARHYCFTHLKKVSALIIDASISALQIGALLALSYFGYLPSYAAWAVIGLASLLTIAVWYFKSGPKIGFFKSSIKSDWGQNWSFGKWAVAGQLVGSFPSFLLPLVLASVVSTTGTGYFAAAMTLIGLANIFNSGMTNFLTPRAALIYVEQGVAGLQKMLIKMAILFLVTLGSFILLIAFCGGWIAELIYGYPNLHTVMTVLAIAKIFEAMVIVASTGLMVMERIKENFYVDICLMIFALIAMACLVSPLGIVGAAWTSAASAIFSAVARLGVLRHFLKVQAKLEQAQLEGAQ